MINKLTSTISTLRVCTVLIFVINHPALAAPWSERHAFCLDKASSSFYSKYNMTKEYNKCMRNADSLIEEYEQLQREYRKTIQRSLQRYDDENRQREKERIMRQQYEDVKQRKKDREDLREQERLFRKFD